MKTVCFDCHGQARRALLLRDNAVGDNAALLLMSFHTNLSPYLQQRCYLNPNTGNKHVRSITNRKRFVGDNVKYCVGLFEEIAQEQDLGPAEDGRWFMINQVGQVVKEMIYEAMREEHGRWQWRGFLMHPWEVDACTHLIMRGYLGEVRVQRYSDKMIRMGLLLAKKYRGERSLQQDCPAHPL